MSSDHPHQHSPQHERLLPSLVDELAHTHPDRILYSLSKTANPADGFLDVSARTFARAVNRCAWYIEDQLGGPGKGWPTLTYLGPQDLNYGILVLACIKTGYKLLLNSPRNSVEAHVRLFEETDCHTFLLPPKFPLPVIKQILSVRSMRVIDIANTLHWLEEGTAKPYPYTKTFEEAKYEPYVVLHTSGSTGWPKPIVQTHATNTTLDAYRSLPSLGYKPAFPTMCAGTRMYVAFPLFHCAGITLLLAASIYNEFTIVLANFPPSADVVNGVHVHGNVQYSAIPTPILVELCKEPELLNNLSRLKLVVFGGGPCPQAVGNLASTKTQVASVLGTTEAGVIPNQIGEPEDWAYLSYSPALGSEYRPYADGLYEHFIVRDDKFARYQGVFGTFPSLKEWAMKDLYSKHPTRENVWLYQGRTDDIIVYQTGEKLNPLLMEEMIGNHPAVNAALVMGHGKFQSILLIEPATPVSSQTEKEALLEQIWSTVEAANEGTPSHARIYRDMVLFTSADRPMLKAGKGTVQRRLTGELYEADAEAIYAAAEAPAVAQVNGFHQKGAERDTVISILRASTNIDTSAVGSDANLFEMGLDSLQVTYLVRGLNSVLATNGQPQSIGPRAIYSHPTIAHLSELLAAKIQGLELNESTEPTEVKMQKIYDQLSAALPISARRPEPHSNEQTILLTGSTGSLGSYILDVLARDSRVTAIYCLNRGPGSESRQKKSHALKGFHSSLEKVRFLDADLSEPYFGLPTASYKALLKAVTAVIHNAWQVDFNLDVSSFASHMTGVRRLVDFSAMSRFNSRIFFISSIGAVLNQGGNRSSSSAVKEQIFDDWTSSQRAGYGQSKLIAERLLDVSVREASVPTTVCRVGQIAGPTTTTGIWPKQEWLPSLISSSAYLGKLPTSLGKSDVVNWIPVDLVAKLIVELSFHDSLDNTLSPDQVGGGASVYHLVNPQTTSWEDLLPVVRQHLSKSSGKHIELVSLADWLDALRRSSVQSYNPTDNPAVKILESYEDLLVGSEDAAVLETVNTVRASRMLGDIGPITGAWMENWLRQWAF